MVVDFGAQYAQLIAPECREARVSCNRLLESTKALVDGHTVDEEDRHRLLKSRPPASDERTLGRRTGTRLPPRVAEPSSCPWRTGRGRRLDLLADRGIAGPKGTGMEPLM